ncbi:MAG TPA: tRNA(His) guanylyltransferase Thg1 family protein [Chloroflexota bacterium]|jgi:tRNA(His) 5'-end guanylyltransferase
MRFDDLDRRLRVYETAHDHCVLPGLHIVTRLDGRNFSRLTADLGLAKPFDATFRDHMVTTTRQVMQCGLRVLYGYTQSDEISLLLHRDEDAFGRKERKLNSILAGEASAALALALGRPCAFDCRVAQLPSLDVVVDYFRWRQEDAHRNALNGHCYWLLRRQGQSEQQAHAALLGKSVRAKHELLFTHGVNYNDLPTWQKRGVGIYWERYERPGYNPYAAVATVATRTRLTADLELPMRAQYDAFLRDLLAPTQ